MVAVINFLDSSSYHWILEWEGKFTNMCRTFSQCKKHTIRFIVSVRAFRSRPIVLGHEMSFLVRYSSH